MRIAIASDAWVPQVNGVVRTLCATVDALRRRGAAVEMITPDRFATMPMPFYRQIRVALAPRATARRLLDGFAPDIVHIATEGPIGWAARGWCRSRGVPFTSAYHTRFPEYLAVRTGLSPRWFWPVLRRFHGASRAVMVATPTLEAELAAEGLPHTRRWSRGIDPDQFHPDGPRRAEWDALPRPILLNVGRVAPEKNLDAFCRLSTPGTKVVVGDGPALAEMRRRYPDVHFIGALSGQALASAYRGADVLVFPSLTDTFGLVIIEALACGLPVAAYRVAGPIDILGPDGRGEGGILPRAAGALDDDLDAAVARALRVARADALALGRRYSWEAATDQFLNALEGALAR
ncbi:glycosyltransferase [Novosphingobium sp. FSY-8]|uniref:Glycosyltransferase n=1 Tax=Novosphingobium ovatum TaxID=1908523 RepID=A0ABW9XEB1_9SPHN|nr:glycosyltransferase family 1 protein [Novosphingobium ovatum]NBC36875.1 glycosyltransferase [Novosphingobium ovatum]